MPLSAAETTTRGCKAAPDRNTDSRTRPSHQRVLPPSSTLEDVPVEAPVVARRLSALRRRCGRAVDPHGAAEDLIYSRSRERESVSV